MCEGSGGGGGGGVWGLGSGSVKKQLCTELAALQALQVQWHASCRPHLHGTHC